MKNGFTEVFETDSVPMTLALCVLTIGAYLIYKLYRFSYQINHFTTFKISPIFMTITMALFVISLGSLIYGIANFHDLTILKSSIGIHIISSVFDVTWIIMVRNRMNMIAGVKKGDKLWLNPYITSIFHVIYMQYKINQGSDKVTI